VATQTAAPLEAITLEEAGSPQRDLTIWIYLLFFTSGIPAIIYQIVWQRALFALYGINIESVTIVVSAFMLGLGLGSLGGGWLSRRANVPLVSLFGFAELGTAAFGMISLPLFHYVGEHTLAQPLWVTGTISFLLVVIPTTLMGATLPLLIEHLVRSNGSVGGSVGALYFVNTLGSGAACIVAVRPLMANLGQTGSVRAAALINVLVGLCALIYSRRTAPDWRRDGSVTANESTQSSSLMLPFYLALFCAGFCGFIALSYEIVWYRLLAFASQDYAAIFASLLGTYLIGIALGSRFAEGYTERNSSARATPVVALTLLASGVLSFLVAPVTAFLLKFLSPVRSDGGWLPTFVFLVLLCHAAMLFGALFPLIAHCSVGSKQAGQGVSRLYAANIAGSTLGVLLVGFVLMDKMSLYQITSILLAGSVLVVLAFSVVVVEPSKLRRVLLVAGCIASLAVVPVVRPVFSTVYDRFLFKQAFPILYFQEIIENRSGTISITPDSMIFGGGVYDGYFNVDLLNDKNMIVRPFALSAFQATPSNVLMIGLGSGSWAQVIANNPAVNKLTVVEINRGYLDAIPNHPETASLLRNPKVTIIIDDGRRWLRRNPDAKFDTVIMNTSFHWRNHISNLLSTEFLQLVRPHLNAGGILFYNTTDSDDVIATAATTFPYILRIFNAVAVSDSPLKFDRARWKQVLLAYAIDGKRIVDRNNPEQMTKLDQIINVPNDVPPNRNSIEEDAGIRARLQRRKNLIITDDNMGLEWR